jgi:hypothetical protein
MRAFQNLFLKGNTLKGTRIINSYNSGDYKGMLELAQTVSDPAEFTDGCRIDGISLLHYSVFKENLLAVDHLV